MSIRKQVDADAPAPDGQGEQFAPDVTPWETGMEVSGHFLEMVDIETQFGESTLLKMDVDNQAMTFGCPFVLRNLLTGVGYGVPITIRCLGKVRQTKGGKAWDFRVWRKGAPIQESLDF